MKKLWFWENGKNISVPIVNIICDVEKASEKIPASETPFIIVTIHNKNMDTTELSPLDIIFQNTLFCSIFSFGVCHRFSSITF